MLLPHFILGDLFRAVRRVKLSWYPGVDIACETKLIRPTLEPTCAS